MASRERSLSRVVGSWLGTQDAGPMRVVRFGQSRKHLCRYVCVEAAREVGLLAIVFFRHDDGSWCVFPQAPRRPVMGGIFDT